MYPVQTQNVLHTQSISLQQGSLFLAFIRKNIMLILQM